MTSEDETMSSFDPLATCVCGVTFDDADASFDAAHWSTPTSSVVVAYSCSELCGDLIERERDEHGALTAAMVTRVHEVLIKVEAASWRCEFCDGGDVHTPTCVENPSYRPAARHLAVPPLTARLVEQTGAQFVGWAVGKGMRGWIVYRVPREGLERAFRLGAKRYW
jgi:hypothetical protein